MMRRFLRMKKVRADLPGGDLPGYYIDAVGGSDSNDGKSSSAAWKTVAKAASVSYASGDHIYFKRGQTFTNVEWLITSPNITVDAYGSGTLPTMDGEYLYPALWSALWEIQADHVTINNIKFIRSASMGVRVYNGSLHGRHNFVVNQCQFDGMALAGVFSWGCDYVTVQYCTFHDCNRINDTTYAGYSANNWESDIMHRYSEQVVDKNNIHTGGYGEVVNTNGACSYVTIQDCIAYDYWGPTFYPINCAHSLVQRCISYCTGNSTYYRSGNRGIGLMSGNESPVGGGSVLDCTFINNLVIGHNINFGWMMGQAGEGFVDSLIANNTFVDAHSDGTLTYSLTFWGSCAHVNTRFVNNLILQEDASAGQVDYTGSSGLTWSHNAWKTLPPAACQGASDYVGPDIKLARTGSVQAGVLTADYFKILDGSGCIDRGLALAEVTEDFWGTARADPPCIGAHELVGGTPAPQAESVSYESWNNGNNFRWYSGGFQGASSTFTLGAGDSVGVRFPGVTIPNGSTIQTAKITVYAAATRSTTVMNTRIKANKASNPNAPTDEAGANGLALTTAYVDWSSIPAWTESAAYQTPDLTTIIQELVDTYDYSAGAAMILLLKDNGTTNGANRIGKFNNTAARLLLEITYFAP